MRSNLVRLARAVKRRGPLVLTGLIVLGGVGCAGLDNLWSRKYRSRLMESPIRTVLDNEDPVKVLVESDDAEDRASALRRLNEPAANDPKHAEVMKLVTVAALSDSHALCRMAAVAKLGDFKDPQAVQVLIAAYTATQPQSIPKEDFTLASKLTVSATSFSSETSGCIQQLALGALGRTKSPEACRYLLEVASSTASRNGSESDRTAALAQRVAAVRALANFTKQSEVEAALVGILQSERDIALRYVAEESYQLVNGKAPTEEMKRIAEPTPVAKQPARSTATPSPIQQTSATAAPKQLPPDVLPLIP